MAWFMDHRVRRGEYPRSSNPESVGWALSPCHAGGQGEDSLPASIPAREPLRKDLSWTLTPRSFPLVSISPRAVSPPQLAFLGYDEGVCLALPTSLTVIILFPLHKDNAVDVLTNCR